MLFSFTLWESAVIDRVLLIIELTTDFGKSFHNANILMLVISDGNLSVEPIHDAHVTRLEARYVQGKKLVKSTYRPVSVSL